MKHRCLSLSLLRSPWLAKQLTSEVHVYYDACEKGGKRSLPFSLATWGLGGRRFKVSNLRYNFYESIIVCLITVMPRSYLERGIYS